MPEILICHRDEDVRQRLVSLLNSDASPEGWRASTDVSAPACDVVITELSDERWRDWLDGEHPRPVVLTGSTGTVDQVVNALSNGAAGFVHDDKLEEQLIELVQGIVDAAARNRCHTRLLESMTSSCSTFEVENDPDMLPALLVRFQASAAMFGVCDEGERARIGMALEEALTNALYHGNLEVSSKLRQQSINHYYAVAGERRAQSPYRERRIHITETMTTDTATFTIRDEGPGFDVSKLDEEPDPENLMAVSGRGIMLMQAFMDDVIYNDSGNEVTLVKRKPAASQTLAQAA